MNYHIRVALLIACIHVANLVKLTLIGDTFLQSLHTLSNRSLNISRIRNYDRISEYMASTAYFSIAKCFSQAKCLAVSQEHDGYFYFVGWDPLPGKPGNKKKDWLCFVLRHQFMYKWA